MDPNSRTTISSPPRIKLPISGPAPSPSLSIGSRVAPPQIKLPISSPAPSQGVPHAEQRNSPPKINLGIRNPHRTIPGSQTINPVPQANKSIGVIFHWGIYSVPAYDSVKSARRRNVQNGSEWYLKRLTDTNTFRPTSGQKDTKAYHLANYGNDSYWNFVNGFTASNWDADEWMRLCQEIGATYVIITAKHHDGFCLFETQTQSPSSVKSINLDIVRRFAESAKKHGLRFGIYYSWLEFETSWTKKYIDSVVIPHLNELRQYRPDIWWFDGNWVKATGYSTQVSEMVCRQLKVDNPDVEINDRAVIKSQEQVVLYQDPRYLGSATYRVYGDRHIPDADPGIPWEHINTIGLSWGRNRQQTQTDYKTGEQLNDLYHRVRAVNGNFLINLGPSEDGTLDPFEVQALRNWSALNRT